MTDKAPTDFDTAWDEADDPESQPPANADQGRTGDDDNPDDEVLEGDDGKPSDPPADAAHAPPAEADENSDEFAGLSEAELREKAKALAAEVKAERDGRSKAENTIRSHEGRVSRAERELNRIRLAQAAAPKEEPKPAEGPKVSDEDLTKVAEEYGDLKPLVEAHRHLLAQVEELRGDRSKDAEAKRQEAERELNHFLDQQATTLTEAHPDWNAVVGTKAYADWAVAQPGWLKDLILRNGNQLVDGEAASFVFDKFKADTKSPEDPDKARREAQLEGNRFVPPRAPAMEARGKGSDSFDAAWDEEDARESRKAKR